MKRKNKKIRNATEASYSGIDFKSRLEVTIYKTLLENGFTPKYEEVTFEFVSKQRPKVPFFNRVGKVFGLEMKPLQPITYTPDFTFEYKGLLVIIEAKGFENDAFYIKKNLFRRHLETLNRPSIFFEVRTKKELLEALEIIKMEAPYIQKIRTLIPSLPDKDVPLGNKFLEARDWEELHNLVTSAITRIERATIRRDDKYANVNLADLYNLQSLIPDNV